jgi:dephospho-CoA kinase
MKGFLIFGQMGSGKDTVADILREYGYTTVKLGKYIRQHVDKLNYIEQDKRPLYQQYGQTMRFLFGENVWNEALYNDIKILYHDKRIEHFAIADGRQKNEFRYWRGKGFYTIGIEASPEIREERLIKRDGVSQKQYFGHQTEVEAAENIKRCDFKLDNNHSIECLREQVEMILKMIK